MKRPPTASNRPMPIFPSEEEIARAVLGDRAGEWPDKALILERRGLPKIDPFYGGRYWPYVVEFITSDITGRGRLDGPMKSAPQSGVRIVPFAPDGVETLDNEKAQAARHQRRDRRGRRTRA